MDRGRNANVTHATRDKAKTKKTVTASMRRSRTVPTWHCGRKLDEAASHPIADDDGKHSAKSETQQAFSKHLAV